MKMTIITDFIRSRKVVFGAYFLLAVLHFLLSLGLNYPVITEDEFVYLGFARWIAGEGVMPHFTAGANPMSFGYSLLLVPAYWLFDSPDMIYKAALAINSLVNPLMLFWLYFLLNGFFKAGKQKSLIISLIVCFYPAYMLQSCCAWTDSVMASFFALFFLLLSRVLKKPAFINILLFGLVSVYIFTIHARGVIAPAIALFIFAVLMFGGKIKLYYALPVIGLMAVLTLAALDFGDGLVLKMIGKENVSQKFYSAFENKLIIIAAAVLIVFSLLAFGKNALAAVLSVFTAFISAYFFRNGDMLLFTIFTAGALLTAFSSALYRKRISIINIILLLFSSAAFLIPHFYLADWQAVSKELDLLWGFIFNALGKGYYFSVSTNLVLILGTVFVAAVLFSRYDFRISQILKERTGLLLLSVVFTAAGTLIIVNHSGIFNLGTFRHDRFFYGRYTETVIAPLFAISLYFLSRLSKKQFLYFSAAAILISLIFYAAVTAEYGSYMEGDSVYHNIMSFFLFRIVFMALDFRILTAFAVTGYLAFAFLFRKNTIFGGLFIAGIFTGLSLAVYVYLIRYDNSFVSQRDKIASTVKNLDLPDTLWCESRLDRSHNMVRIQYILPELRVEFFNPKDTVPGSFILAESGYPRFNTNAVLFASEHDGNDFLWYLPDVRDTLSPYLPKYINLDVSDSLLTGIIRKNFMPGNFAGNSLLKIPHFQSDTIKSIFIKAKNDLDKNRFRLLFDSRVILDTVLEKGYFSKDIKIDFSPNNNKSLYENVVQTKKSVILKPGFHIKEEILISPSRDLKMALKKINKYYEIEIKVSFIKEDTCFKGLKLLELIPKGKTVRKLYSMQIRRKEVSELQIFPGYDIFSYRFKGGDTIEIPFQIYDPALSLKDIDSLRLRYIWSDYAFKRTIFKKSISFPQILTEEEPVILSVPVIVPQMQGRAFLNFDIIDKKGKRLNIHSRFLNLIIH